MKRVVSISRRLHASGNATGPVLAVVAQPSRDVAWLRHLGSAQRIAAASSTISRSLASFRAQRREALAPSSRRGARWLLSRLGLSIAGHVTAALHLGTESWPVALGALVVGAMATGSLLVAVHDLAHGTFFPSQRANTWIGHALSSLFFVDFSAFRRAHLQHHRAPQSTEDPNFAFLEAIALAPARVDHPPGDRAQRRPMIVAWSRLTQSLPMAIRTLLYLPALVLLYPLVLFGSRNELSLLRRDFRDRRSWLPFIAPLLLYGSLWLVWPTLVGCMLLAVWMTFVTTFMLVLPHSFEEQLVFFRPIPRNVAALNASDVRFGPIVRWFTGGISDYHAAHHLDCSVPIYALPLLGRWVDAEFQDWKATPVSASDWSLLPRYVDRVLRLTYGRRDEDWHLVQMEG